MRTVAIVYLLLTFWLWFFSGVPFVVALLWPIALCIEALWVIAMWVF